MYKIANLLIVNENVTGGKNSPIKKMPNSISATDSEVLHHQQCFHNLKKDSAQCNMTHHFSDTNVYCFCCFNYNCSIFSLQPITPCVQTVTRTRSVRGDKSGPNRKICNSSNRPAQSVKINMPIAKEISAGLCYGGGT